MSNEVLKKGLIETNAPVLANAIELGAEIIASIAGNAASNEVDGQKVDRPFLHSAIAARLQYHLTKGA